ncbi:biopolymer transporter ExbD [Campylobacter sp. RM9344]|uniref:Biopolymer transporter ExbD n=1 Tax=Campylobacter californiensis TaxID=1032243 RepID=A0AAW3ZVE0_9BACT|nr:MULTISPECIES: biopolymer transporter ExbD [unclassified Campylobacter]MBE2984407.1 biopolymer transporter ExbD [Campylobacter sp. RM6883]MBE2985745.1 biopolymer transporter ExbD [Campylobacter sp. RM12919]MBE2987860.1 biopolymer transporter ExbD [Campylobacter sp. RM12920]MBE2995842.1 biopolymer transporter ExbD [Campylobacter sp. RM6913]MBE3029673.1 biopolymer transporter ExbD [Campylobacter sp. RM9344]
MALKFDEGQPELNITPLVDIMLVLLAILMVTAPTIVYQEDIALPDGSKTKTSAAKQKDLVVYINVERKVRIEQALINLAELPDNVILMAAKYDKSSPVYIKADKNLKYDDVMFVLKTLKNAGFNKVALETNG